MPLLNLRTEQLAQILGYSIIGYGVSFLFDAFGPLNKLYTFISTVASVGPEIRKPMEGMTDALANAGWTIMAYSAVAFALCFSAGFVIKNMQANPKPLGLAVAVLFFGFFPLGTLVSVYTLVFLFAIYEKEGEEETAFVKLNL